MGKDAGATIVSGFIMDRDDFFEKICQGDSDVEEHLLGEFNQMGMADDDESILMFGVVLFSFDWDDNAKPISDEGVQAFIRAPIIHRRDYLKALDEEIKKLQDPSERDSFSEKAIAAIERLQEYARTQEFQRLQCAYYF